MSADMRVLCHSFVSIPLKIVVQRVSSKDRRYEGAMPQLRLHPSVLIRIDLRHRHEGARYEGASVVKLVGIHIRVRQ